MKWKAKSMSSKQRKQSNDISRYHFQLHILHKAAKSKAKLIHQPVMWYIYGLQPSYACPGEPFKDDPGTLKCLTSFRTRNCKSWPGNLQHKYLPRLLVNVYSYQMVVKSICLAVVCSKIQRLKGQFTCIVMRVKPFKFIT